MEMRKSIDNDNILQIESTQTESNQLYPNREIKSNSDLNELELSKSKENFTDSNSFEDVLATKLAQRKQQDDIWKITNDLSTNREDLNKIYTSILVDDQYDSSKKSLKNLMLQRMYDNNYGEQGSAVGVPIDFHKGPFMNAEDKYYIIFEADSESKILDNQNSELIRTIGNTEVTNGMKAYAEGIKWNNGLICNNKNSIILRNADNNFGQPGFLTGFFYNDRLAVEILNRYLVVDLINQAIRNNFTIMTDPDEVKKFITERYNEVRNNLLEKLEDSEMTESQLFFDAPIRDNPNISIADSALRIEFEKRIRILEERVEYLLKRLEEVEELALDSAIIRNENAINDNNIDGNDNKINDNSN